MPLLLEIPNAARSSPPKHVAPPPTHQQAHAMTGDRAARHRVALSAH